MNSSGEPSRNPSASPQPEPWLRGTNSEVPAVARAVLHALELAGEDLQKWCSNLTDRELNDQPPGLPPVSFHLRHIARSLDRLLTYAEGRGLSKEQLALLKSEQEPGVKHQALFRELDTAIDNGVNRIRALARQDLEQSRTVGKKALPTTVGGLLVHIADHTQRHVGQAISTAKLLIAQRT
jgi:uncharacterized damage-inducible protein DinB